MISTSSTAVGFARLIEKEGGILKGYGIAFDRQERGTGDDGKSGTAEFTEQTGVPVVAAATLDDLVVILEGAPLGSSKEAVLERILTYREQYGC